MTGLAGRVGSMPTSGAPGDPQERRAPHD
jgi:hypothetical protein